jgi:hypothetical protein
MLPPLWADWCAVMIHHPIWLNPSNWMF